MGSPRRCTLLACALVTLAAAAAPACGKSKRTPAPSATPTPRPTTASPLPSPTPALSPEERFQSAATEVAARTGRVVAGWGALDLDDQPGPECFASLLDADAPGMDDGAYLIGAGAQLWLVRFEHDGRTSPFGVDEATPPAWKELTETRISHSQSHHHGYQHTDFALHAGQLVVLRSELLDDVTANDTPVTHEFTCPACPALDQSPDDDTLGPVVGPASSAAALLALPSPSP